ncbi:MAG: hypothetical protein RDV41_04095 [Planctomycetota bacterium]|nr:hypothetical protein [Planctomycetota bacterium]
MSHNIDRTSRDRGSPSNAGGTPPELLARLAYEGARRLYGPEKVNDATVRDRLDYELTVIERLGFCDYFLVVWDIAQFARRAGIPVVGRGSAASSLVAYALGITNVCPLEFDLPFERFLNPSRTDPPDIDLDICWKRRDEVLAYVYTKYGRTRNAELGTRNAEIQNPKSRIQNPPRVAMVSTHNTFQVRSAFREIAKTFGLPLDEINSLASRLPYYGGTDLRKVISLLPECRGFPVDVEPYKTILALTEQVIGFPHHLSIHVGGIVIAPDSLTNYLPLQLAAKEINGSMTGADESVNGAAFHSPLSLWERAGVRDVLPTQAADRLVITQYDMTGVEATGLVKIDLLGHRALSVIADTIMAVNSGAAVSEDVTQSSAPRAAAMHSRDGCATFPAGPGRRDAVLSSFDAGRLSGDDPLTATLLREGRTIGCFQLESPGMRALLKQIRAETRRDAIIALSLIRPGPSASGMKELFIRRRLGREPVRYVHPSLEPVLKETCGIMLFQEDILRVAKAEAGFSLEEADMLRRAVSKKRSKEKIEELRDLFFAGAAANGVPADATEKIWDWVGNFAAYSYCKAHAVTYGFLAYQTVYLKSRYPAEFFAAMIANRAGFYQPRVYLEEARRMGVKILLPDVNLGRRTTEAEYGGP